MTALLVAHLTVEDPVRYAHYVEPFLPILKQYGGEVLLVDEAPEPVEGDLSPGRLVVLSFVDKQAAWRWYHSAEYQAILPNRQSSSRTDFIVIAETESAMAAAIAEFMH